MAVANLITENPLLQTPTAADTETTGLIPWGGLRTVEYNFGTAKHPDVETRQVHPARPFAYSFCDHLGNTLYVRQEVDPKTRAVAPIRPGDRTAMEDILADERIAKVAHNARYDLMMYRFAGLRVRGHVFDTMIVSHIATAGDELTYALKPLAAKYVDYDDSDEKTLHRDVIRARSKAKKARWSFATDIVGGRNPANADYWMADPSLVQRYAVGDVERCQLLYQLWMPMLISDPRKFSLFKREHELFWVLKSVEDTGIRVYPNTVKRLRKFYVAYSAQWERKAEAIVGPGVNLNSPKQMSKIFFDDRGHPPVYTEKGNYSLNGETLLKLATGYVHLVNGRSVTVDPDPLAKAALEKRAADQTIGTFLDVYERYWVEESPGIWSLHPSFRQTGAKTGRLSCADPNMQQVASETTGRRKADIQSRPREAFGPRPNCYWYLPDYSQIEVWLFAFMSGEKAMQEALLSGHDFHGTIAKEVFGRRPDFEAAKDYYRKCAKLIMFAKLYGGGLAKMAALLKTDIDSAREFVDTYEARLPGVATFMSRMMTKATREGVIWNPYGREYTFEPHFAYRSVNYLIQGTAADVMKNALIRVHLMLLKRWDGVPRITMTIHDEICVEVPRRYHSQELLTDVIREMQADSTMLGIPVPLPVGVKVVEPDSRWNHTVKVKMAA